MTGPPGDGSPPGPEPSGWGFDPQRHDPQHQNPQQQPHGYPPPYGQPGGYGLPYPNAPYPVRTPPMAGPHQVKAGPAILGFLIGAVTAATGLMTTTMLLIQALDAGDTRYVDHSGQASLIASALWGAAAAALLAFPKTRRAGAGLLAGLAVGVILLSGVCLALSAAT